MILQNGVQERAQKVLNLLTVVMIGDEVDCLGAKSGEGVGRLVDAFAFEDQKELHDFGPPALKLFAGLEAALVGNAALPEAVSGTVFAVHVDGECEA